MSTVILNEPKKSLIEAAARKRWPNMVALIINQRKHTARVTLEIKAESHRQLLEIIERGDTPCP